MNDAKQKKLILADNPGSFSTVSTIDEILK